MDLRLPAFLAAGYAVSMSRSQPAPGARLRRIWRWLEPIPGGSRLFSRMVGWMAPYSGSVRPHVRELEPGRCVVELTDRRRVRNHLDSVHAVALTNLGELSTGLATLTALPVGVRGIVVKLETTYGKKARGRLRAECRTDVATPDEAAFEHVARAEIRDRDGGLVATVASTWRLSPPKEAR